MNIKSIVFGLETNIHKQHYGELVNKAFIFQAEAPNTLASAPAEKPSKPSWELQSYYNMWRTQSGKDASFEAFKKLFEEDKKESPPSPPSTRQEIERSELANKVQDSAINLDKFKSDLEQQYISLERVLDTRAKVRENLTGLRSNYEQMNTFTDVLDNMSGNEQAALFIAWGIVLFQKPQWAKWIGIWLVWDTLLNASTWKWALWHYNEWAQKPNLDEIKKMVAQIDGKDLTPNWLLWASFILDRTSKEIFEAITVPADNGRGVRALDKISQDAIAWRPNEIDGEQIPLFDSLRKEYRSNIKNSEFILWITWILKKIWNEDWTNDPVKWFKKLEKDAKAVNDTNDPHLDKSSKMIDLFVQNSEFITDYVMIARYIASSSYGQLIEFIWSSPSRMGNCLDYLKSNAFSVKNYHGLVNYLVANPPLSTGFLPEKISARISTPKLHANLNVIEKYCIDNNIDLDSQDLFEKVKGYSWAVTVTNGVIHPPPLTKFNQAWFNQMIQKNK